MNVNGSTMMVDGAWGDSQTASAETSRVLVQTARDDFVSGFARRLRPVARDPSALLERHGFSQTNDNGKPPEPDRMNTAGTHLINGLMGSFYAM